MGRHTAPIPAVTTDEMDEWEAMWAETDPDEWMEPLRHGGVRVGRRMRRTLRERGLMLVRRISDRSDRLRKILEARR